VDDDPFGIGRRNIVDGVFVGVLRRFDPCPIRMSTGRILEFGGRFGRDNRIDRVDRVSRLDYHHGCGIESEVKMKWFKHLTLAHRDDKLVGTRVTFGMWGIGCYWTLVEMCGEQVKATNPAGTVKIRETELCSLFGCKPAKTREFLRHCQTVLGMNIKPSGAIPGWFPDGSPVVSGLFPDGSGMVPGTFRESNAMVFEINIPKLLSLLDNYTKDYQVISKNVSIEEEGEGEKEKEHEKQKIVSRVHAMDINELKKMEFKLRLHDDEFQIFVHAIEKQITMENATRTTSTFRWTPTTGTLFNDLRTIVYKISDEEKQSLLWNAYSVIGEKLNWAEYAGKCVRVMLVISRKKPIHKPLAFVLHLLKNPQTVVSELTDGSVAHALKGISKWKP
jgi:hypothetical protein